MKAYAGIGSRKLNETDWNLCYKTGFWLARQGWKLQTGAAQGADRAFAEGALDAGGKVLLCLPWPRYERRWVGNAACRGAVTKVLQYFHKDAWASVAKYHPAGDTLRSAIKSLHARNYLIVEGTSFCLAFPKSGPRGGLGGTGQGIRICTGKGIQVIRLDEPFDRTRVEDRVL